MRARICILAMVLVAVGAAGGGRALAQGHETRWNRSDMTVVRRGDALLASFRFGDIINPARQKRLSDGFTSRILVAARLLAGPKRVPVAQGLLEITVRYDVWEETYFVSIQGAGGLRKLQLRTMEDVLRACTVVEKMPLIPMLPHPAEGPFRLEVQVQVNPTSPELMRKVRDYLVNPDGRASMGGGTKFFSSISRIFVNQADFKAEAQVTYRSRDIPAIPTEGR
jgi:hypothetical protein